MHHYHRPMRRKAATTLREDEQSQLLAPLKSAPGIKNVEILGLHLKGGYRVKFDLSVDSIESFLDYSTSMAKCRSFSSWPQLR